MNFNDYFLLDHLLWNMVFLASLWSSGARNFIGEALSDVQRDWATILNICLLSHVQLHSFTL